MFCTRGGLAPRVGEAHLSLPLTVQEALERMYRGGWRLMDGWQTAGGWIALWGNGIKQVRGRGETPDDALEAAYKSIRRQYGERAFR